MSASTQPPSETKGKAFWSKVAVVAILAIVVSFAFIVIRTARERNLAYERQIKWLSAYLDAVRQVRDAFAANAPPAVIEKHLAEAQQFGQAEDPSFAERDENDRDRIQRIVLNRLHEAVKRYADAHQNPAGDNKVTVRNDDGTLSEVDKKVILRQNGDAVLKQAEAEWQKGAKADLLPPPDAP